MAIQLISSLTSAVLEDAADTEEHGKDRLSCSTSAHLGVFVFVCMNRIKSSRKAAKSQILLSLL